MAKAAPESALTFVALKVVLAELEARPLESPESARRLVAQVCDADRDRNYWTCREPADPPATFWRNPAQLTFSGSDVTNPAASLAEGDLDSLPGIGPAFMFGFVAVTLRALAASEIRRISYHHATYSMESGEGGKSVRTVLMLIVQAWAHTMHKPSAHLCTKRSKT